MATLRRKKAEPFSVFQRDPGPWPPILLNWMATLAIIMVFGLVMLFSASYTTGYLRFGDSFHYIKSQLLCTVLGLGMMFLFSYFVVFNVMGRSYDAAVMTAGFIGFAMGATSNAMANMQVVTKKYGPSPVAYFAIPMVGGMFINFFNAVLISANIGWWA